MLLLLEKDGSRVAPGAFLPAAERYHLAPRIDRWVLQRALTWMQGLPAPVPGVVDTICVNLIRDLIDDRLDEAAVRCFADVARVAGLRTVAECVDHPDVLQQLRIMGVNFAQGDIVQRPAPIDELMPA